MCLPATRARRPRRSAVTASEGPQCGRPLPVRMSARVAMFQVDACATAAVTGSVRLSTWRLFFGQSQPWQGHASPQGSLAVRARARACGCARARVVSPWVCSVCVWQGGPRARGGGGQDQVAHCGIRVSDSESSDLSPGPVPKKKSWATLRGPSLVSTGLSAGLGRQAAAAGFQSGARDPESQPPPPVAGACLGRQLEPSGAARSLPWQAAP